MVGAECRLGSPEAVPSDAELRATTRRGIAVLMDGDPDGAIEIFRQIQKADPQSPLGYLFEVITHCYGAMPSYRAQVSAADRWAIIAYVRALQYADAKRRSEQ